MLLNISNHPINTWTAKQLDMAWQDYGQPVDFVLPNLAPNLYLSKNDILATIRTLVPFPHIPPYFSSTKVSSLASRYAQHIAFNYPLGNFKAIHIMGEFSFTHDLINRLQHYHYNCICSTTVRNNTSNEYEFFSFRAYTTL